MWKRAGWDAKRTEDFIVMNKIKSEIQYSAVSDWKQIMIDREIIDRIRVPPGKEIRLKDYDTGWATKEMKELGKDTVKERAKAILEKNLQELAIAQELLYADDRYGLLVILQAMDAAGKDGTI